MTPGGTPSSSTPDRPGNGSMGGASAPGTAAPSGLPPAASSGLGNIGAATPAPGIGAASPTPGVAPLSSGAGTQTPAPSGEAAREAAIAPGGPTGPGTMPDDLPRQGATRDWGHAYETERRPEAPRSELGSFLDDLSELARGEHGDLRGELERRVSQARDRLSSTYDGGLDAARDRMQRGLEASRDAVVERPLSSLAIAAGAGLVIGLLLARRSS